MSTVIRVENLSKKYIIGHQKQAPYFTFRDHLSNGISGLWIRSRNFFNSPARPSLNSSTHEQFWALKDLSFEIKQGDRVGIIGQNGAGKSTLLKILSRITEPTSGKVSIKGKVSSLLEVGTGFHPELTGRENIYLNGAILGMSRGDIKNKFDEIIAFAETEKFLDTPVKHYSSGMYVRLAFAIAAHLEPEILIVDEVLAVGDAQFQKKSLGKMEEVGKAGRTVFFVSHNMLAIRQLCDRAICLHEGKMLLDGASDDVANRYLKDGPKKSTNKSIAEVISQLPADSAIRFNSISIRQDGTDGYNVITGKPVEIIVDYTVLQETYGLRIFFMLYDTDEMLLLRSFAHAEQKELPYYKPGRYRSIAAIPADFLAPISYEIRISASIYNVRLCYPDPVAFDLSVHDSGRLRNVYAATGPIGVKLAPIIPWRTESC